MICSQKTIEVDICLTLSKLTLFPGYSSALAILEHKHCPTEAITPLIDTSTTEQADNTWIGEIPLIACTAVLAVLIVGLLAVLITKFAWKRNQTARLRR